MTASPATSLHLESAIRQRLALVHEQIAAAARGAGRSPHSVRVVVVTKGQPLQVVHAAIQAGARILGENYAEEATQKIEAVRRAPLDGGRVEWHMVGHVQGRKAKLVAPYFDMIHSVDSVTLAQRLNSLGEGMGRPLAVLLEFNVGGEPGKHGWGAADPAAWPQLLADMETVVNLAHLHVRGLMTMPPLAATPEDSRRFFDLLRQLQGYLVENVTGADWTELSMGTSSDFTVAVEEGATLVRVGEAILGPRITRETK